MAVLLALASALAYGVSDFLGGLVSRLTSVWAVAVVVQTTSALGAAALAVLDPGDPAASDLAWAVLAGAGSGSGVCFLFRGLSSGRMGVVAPLSAVGSALLPVVLGLALGERPGALVALGLVAAFPGIWLVAREEDRPVPAPVTTSQRRTVPAGVGDGILAGTGFGVMFAALGQVPDGAGLWPLTTAQAVSALTAVVLATALRQPWRPTRTAWRAVPAGLLGTTAVLCFQLATQDGLLTVSSVLASLYPAATILLAVVVLGERIHRVQAGGLVLCGVAVTLVALG